MCTNEQRGDPGSLLRTLKPPASVGKRLYREGDTGSHARTGVKGPNGCAGLGGSPDLQVWPLMPLTRP